MGGERGSGISALMARHDDDDEFRVIKEIYGVNQLYGYLPLAD